MNERQRLLMQKIAEYGDFKYRKGLMFKHVTATSEPKRYTELSEKAEELFSEITNMVIEWVPVNQEGPSDESYGDLRVVVPENPIAPYRVEGVTTTVTTLRKKDELDREVAN